MAGDWIKFECATLNKPEVAMMSARLERDPDEIIGKLLRWWHWLDENTENGNAVSVTKAFIDRITFCEGFANALCQVSWLEGRDGRFSVPNFDRHNGETAKKRALSQKRTQKHRAKCNVTNVTDVTQPALQTRYQRREEKSIKRERENAGARKESTNAEIPSIEEVIRYGEMQNIPETECRAFFVHYDGKSLWWNRHGRPVKWQVCLTSWKTNGQANGQRSHGSNPTAAQKPEGAWALKTRIEAIKAQMESEKSLDDNYDYVNGIRLDTDPMNEKGRAKMRELRASLKSLNEQLATAQ